MRIGIPKEPLTRLTRFAALVVNLLFTPAAAPPFAFSDLLSLNIKNCCESRNF